MPKSRKLPVFAPIPDPASMYLTRPLREAVKKIHSMIDRCEGLAVIYGDNGFGKSSLLRMIAGSYNSDPDFNVAYLANNTHDVSPMAFLRMICKDLGIPGERSRIAQVSAFEDFLYDATKRGKSTVVLIDEAHLLPADTMEIIRSLLNYETALEKMCQVVMAGELTFRDRMETKRYKAFRSRIVAPVVLQLFTEEETIEMIAHRHRRWNLPNKFTLAACKELHMLTSGVPRDSVLMAGYASRTADEEGIAEIGPELIQRAAQQLTRAHSRESVEAAGA